MIHRISSFCIDTNTVSKRLIDTQPYRVVIYFIMQSLLDDSSKNSFYLD